MSLIMCVIDESRAFDEFDPAMDRLDQILYGGEPSEPDCMMCYDRRRLWPKPGRSRPRWCQDCSPREGVFRRRMGRAVRRQRRWERYHGLEPRGTGGSRVLGGFDAHAPF